MACQGRAGDPTATEQGKVSDRQKVCPIFMAQEESKVSHCDR